MFENRHITCGIQATIPPEIVSFIWSLIDDMLQSGHDVDYLQVFNLCPDEDATGKPIQVVSHTQENPDYKAIYNLYLALNPIRAKVYVVDDASNLTTMLLAQEY